MVTARIKIRSGKNSDLGAISVTHSKFFLKEKPNGRAPALKKSCLNRLPVGLRSIGLIILLLSNLDTALADNLPNSSDLLIKIQVPRNADSPVVTGYLAPARAIPPNGPDGKGNFKVCLLKNLIDISDRDSYTVTVPPNMIFESAGRLIGDLRNPGTDTAYAKQETKTNWSVIAQKSFTLSNAEPCASISVRSVTSSWWPWIFPLVRQEDHLFFQTLKVRGHENGTQDYPDRVGQALDSGLINGTPIADIGNPLELGSEKL